MNIKRVTKYFIIITLAIIIAYDVWAWKMGGVPGTISQVMANWTLDYGPLNYLLMYVLGHFTWPTYVTTTKD